MSAPRVWPGQPYPLGATWDGSGANFALFSENAEKVELCLFSAQGEREEARIRLTEYTDETWHCYLPDARPGLLYGYRVFGPYDPVRGHRFNHHKLLLDPYAKALYGKLTWNDANFGYTVSHKNADLSFDTRDNAPYVPKSRVMDTAFTWSEHPRPKTPWHETIIYELHVRGFTMRHPEVPQPLRGTFAGLSSPASVRYLAELGVTAIELLPVHAFIGEPSIVGKGLSNYWGYNPIAFFAPHSGYCRRRPLGEFKTMVQLLHDVGIEVILDVVYNHTAEGNQLGPTLCYRGIDNASYYRLVPDDKRHYQDFTGCGNALNLHHPRVLQLVMDSLRYWVEEMHVDGFRFDLATTLARESDGAFDQHSGFLDAIRQDPVLSKTKLIAESWDVGLGGYQVGNFPPGWAEWNDRFRDTVRRYWKGEDGLAGELAYRVTGSSDIFQKRGRRPWASVNYVTAHDGFTLHDLVSYDHKYNWANGEENRDGIDANHSWNCGAEGPTDEEEVLVLRERQKRNLLATLLTSQGVPMVLAGDEFGRTQRGNNNAYCQDNDVSWVDWGLAGTDRGGALLAFTRRVIALRRAHIVFHRHRFFHGATVPGANVKDIIWLRPDGTEKQESDWADPDVRCLSFVLSGEAGERHRTPFGDPEPDDTFVVIMNAQDTPVEHRLPTLGNGQAWTPVIDTSRTDGAGKDDVLKGGDSYPVAERAFLLFRLVAERPDR